MTRVIAWLQNPHSPHPHGSEDRAPVFQSGGRLFKSWVGTGIYVPAMLRSGYLLANKGYARPSFFFFKKQSSNTV